MLLGQLSPRGTYFPQGVCGSSPLQPTPVSLLALLLALGPCTTTLWPHVLGLPSNAVSGPTFIYLLTRSPSDSSDGRETTWMTLKLTHPSEACLLWECFHVCHLGFFFKLLRISQAGPWITNVKESWADSMVSNGLLGKECSPSTEAF